MSDFLIAVVIVVIPRSPFGLMMTDHHQNGACLTSSCRDISVDSRNAILLVKTVT